MRPYRNPRQVYIRPLDTVPEEPGGGLASFEIESQQSRSNQTSFLVPLSAIVAVTGAVVIPAVQGGIRDFESLSLTLPAAVCEATIFASYARSEGPKAVMAYLGATLSVMHTVELLSGFGSPNKGGTFHDSAALYSSTIENILTNANPDPDAWTGVGAEAYAQGNSAQQDLVNRIAQADQQIANRLKYQADQVQDARNGMAYCRLVLTGALVVMGILLAAFIKAAGSGQIELAGAIAAVADGFGNFFAILTLAGDLAMVGFLLTVGEKTKDIAEAAADVYAEIVDSVEPGLEKNTVAPSPSTPNTVALDRANMLATTAGTPRQS